MTKEAVGYLPGQDPGDIKATNEYQEALQKLLKSLDSRQGLFDPQMLAMAEGFLKPTQTGSFGESLGYAVAGARQAGMQQQEREQKLAQTRLELAGQNVALQRQKARERMFQQAIGEPTGASGGAGEGEGAPRPSAGATAPSGGPVGASDVAAGVAQQGAGRLTGGIRIAPPDKSFPTYQQFMKEQFMDPSISVAQANKNWQDLLAKQTEVRETGVFHRPSGMFYPAPRAETVERQIAGKTYRVPYNLAVQMDSADPQQRQELEQQFLSGGADVGAGPGAASRAGRPVSVGEAAARQKAAETSAVKLAESSAQKEANAISNYQTAMRLDQTTRRLEKIINESPQAFGMLNKPGIATAILTIIDQGLAAGNTRISLGGLQDAIRKVDKNINQKDLDNISRALGDYAELNLQFRRIYYQGQGSVSNMEAQVAERIPGGIEDSPQAALTKVQLLRMRADFEMKVGKAWRKMKRADPGLSYLDFEMSDEYDGLLNQYDDALRAKFGDGSTDSGQQTAAPSRPASSARTGAPPRAAVSGAPPFANARNRAQQLLRGGQ